MTRPVLGTSRNVAIALHEVGFKPLGHKDGCLFFHLVSYRDWRGATTITTNTIVKHSPGILAGDEAMTAAILDRLLHRSAVLNIRGRGHRLQDIEKLLK